MMAFLLNLFMGGGTGLPRKKTLGFQYAPAGRFNEIIRKLPFNPSILKKLFP